MPQHRQRFHSLIGASHPSQSAARHFGIRLPGRSTGSTSTTITRYSKTDCASRGHQPARSSSVGGNPHLDLRAPCPRATSGVYLGQNLERRASQAGRCGRTPASTGSPILRGKTGSAPAATIPVSTIGCCSAGAALERSIATRSSWFRKVDGLETAEARASARRPRPAEGGKKGGSASPPLGNGVRDGKVDARGCGCWRPAHLFAADAGPQIIDIEPLADDLVHHDLVEPAVRRGAIPDVVERFLKGMIEGVHFFKTQPEPSIDIIQAGATIRKAGSIRAGQATYIYHQLGAALGAQALSHHGGDRRTSTRRPRRRRMWMPARSIRWSCGTCHHIRRLDDARLHRRVFTAISAGRRAGRSRAGSPS